MSASTCSAVVAATAVVAAGAHTIYPYWYRDVQVVRQTRALENALKVCADSKLFIVDLFEVAAAKTPYKPFIIYNDTLYSYHDIDVMANKMSHFAQNQGLHIGDTVAILMRNEPAYIWAWLGFAKLGIKCALINYNLRSDSLLHCIDISEAKTVLVGKGEDLIRAVREIEDELHDRQMGIWSVGNKLSDTVTSKYIRYIDDQLTAASDLPPSPTLRSAMNIHDTILYIFTSGTTGLPKAARYPNTRYLRASFRFSSIIGNSDVIYITTPLYHAVGFCLAVGAAIRSGATCVIAPKFSTRHFWQDCCKHNVTVFFYVGELCRYLLAAPERPEDKLHKVRCMIGNGLQTDIWNKFLSRFHIHTIAEFYGATDLPFFSINTDKGKPGVVGMFSPLLRKLGSFEIVKCDYEIAEPIRDSKGRCIPVKYGEPGLLLSKPSGLNQFYGYHGNKKLSEKRILHNVLQEDDKYINSGDLMMLDRNFYLYFVDRLGDTFRWQGENVSTTEVAQALTSFPSVQEAILYGVTVPGHNGRAGMAAVILKDGYHNLDFHQLYTYLHSKLPPYACPRFIRIRQTLDMTGTFKYTKTDLMKEGFDPSIVCDAIFVMDSNSQTYRLLDSDVYKSITVGAARL
ncbi:long-chain fatty acid transport protein 6-like [Glandiceps talaboti]